MDFDSGLVSEVDILFKFEISDKKNKWLENQKIIIQEKEAIKSKVLKQNNNEQGPDL